MQICKGQFMLEMSGLMSVGPVIYRFPENNNNIL